MGGLCQKFCPKKSEEDPGILEDLSKDESQIDDPYDINYEVTKNVVVIYIYPACSKECQCTQILSLFSSINSKPIVNDISLDSNPKKLLKALRKLADGKKPPFVFLTGKYLGGYTEAEAGIQNHTVQRAINKWLDSRVRFGQN